MADKFKISGSNTGDYYQIVNGKRKYFDKKGNPMEESVFLANNNAQIAKDGSMRKKENLKDGLVKQYVKGSKSGRYYTVDNNGNKTYFAKNDKPLKKDYFFDKEGVYENANGQLVKKPVQQEEKGYFGSLWDSTCGAWDGIKKMGKELVTDEKGELSWTGGAKKVWKATKNVFRDETGKVSWKGVGQALMKVGEGALNSVVNLGKSMFCEKDGTLTWGSALRGVKDLVVFAAAISVGVAVAAAAAAAIGVAGLTTGVIAGIVGLIVAAPLIMEGANKGLEGANTILDSAKETDLIKAGSIAKDGLNMQTEGQMDMVIGELTRRCVRKGAEHKISSYEANLARSKALTGKKCPATVRALGKTLMEEPKAVVKGVGSLFKAKTYTNAWQGAKNMWGRGVNTFNRIFRKKTSYTERIQDAATLEEMQGLFEEISNDNAMGPKSKAHAMKELANEADNIGGREALGGNVENAINMRNFADAVRDQVKSPEYARLEAEIDNSGYNYSRWSLPLPRKWGDVLRPGQWKRAKTNRRVRTEVNEREVKNINDRIDKAQSDGKITTNQAEDLRARLTDQQESTRAYSRMKKQVSDKKTEVTLDEEFDYDISAIKNAKQRDVLLRKLKKTDLTPQEKMAVYQKLLDTCKTEADFLEFNRMVRTRGAGINNADEAVLHRLVYQKLQKMNPKKYPPIDNLTKNMKKDAKALKKEADKAVKKAEESRQETTGNWFQRMGTKAKKWITREKPATNAQVANANYAVEYAKQHLSEVNKAGQAETAAEFDARLRSGKNVKNIADEIEKAKQNGEITEVDAQRLAEEAKTVKNYANLKAKVQRAKSISEAHKMVSDAAVNREITTQQCRDLYDLINNFERPNRIGIGTHPQKYWRSRQTAKEFEKRIKNATESDIAQIRKDLENDRTLSSKKAKKLEKQLDKKEAELNKVNEEVYDEVNNNSHTERSEEFQGVAEEVADVVDCPESIAISDMPQSRYDFTSVDKPSEVKSTRFHQENGETLIDEYEFEGKKYTFDETSQRYVSDDGSYFNMSENEYTITKPSEFGSGEELTRVINKETGNVEYIDGIDSVTRDVNGNIVETVEWNRLDDGRTVTVTRNGNGEITHSEEIIRTNDSYVNIQKDGSGRVMDYYKNEGETSTIVKDDYSSTHISTESKTENITTFKVDKLGFKQGEKLRVVSENGKTTVEVVDANGKTTQYPTDESGAFIRNGKEYQVAEYSDIGFGGPYNLWKPTTIKGARACLDRCVDEASLDALANAMKSQKGTNWNPSNWKENYQRSQLLKEIEAKKQQLNNVDMRDVKLETRRTEKGVNSGAKEVSQPVEVTQPTEYSMKNSRFCRCEMGADLSNHSSELGYMHWKDGETFRVVRSNGKTVIAKRPPKGANHRDVRDGYRAYEFDGDIPQNICERFANEFDWYNMKRNSEGITKMNEILAEERAGVNSGVNSGAKEVSQPAQTVEPAKPEAPKQSVQSAENLSKDNINMSVTYNGHGQTPGNTHPVGDYRTSIDHTKGYGIVEKDGRTSFVIKQSGRVGDNYTVQIDGTFTPEQQVRIAEALKDGKFGGKLDNTFRQKVADFANEVRQSKAPEPAKHAEQPAKTTASETAETPNVQGDSQPVRKTFNYKDGRTMDYTVKDGVATILKDGKPTSMVYKKGDKFSTKTTKEVYEFDGAEFKKVEPKKGNASQAEQSAISNTDEVIDNYLRNNTEDLTKDTYFDKDYEATLKSRVEERNNIISDIDNVNNSKAYTEMVDRIKGSEKLNEVDKAALLTELNQKKGGFKPIEGDGVRLKSGAQKVGSASRAILGTLGFVAGAGLISSRLGAGNNADDVDEKEEVVKNPVDEVVAPVESDEVVETEETETTETTSPVTEDDISSAETEEALNELEQRASQDELSNDNGNVQLQEQPIGNGKYTVIKGNDRTVVVKDKDGKVIPVNQDGTVIIDGKKYKVTPDGIIEEIKDVKQDKGSAEFSKDTYKDRIQGPKDSDGNKPEIDHTQVVAFTKAIQSAATEEDLNNILSDLFTFKMFKGRKQLRTAIRARRKVLEHSNDQKYVDKKIKKIQDKTFRAVERFDDKRKSFLGIRLGKGVKAESNQNANDKKLDLTEDMFGEKEKYEFGMDYDKHMFDE